MNKAPTALSPHDPALQRILPDLVAFLADPDRFASFAALTGMDAQDLRSALAEPGFAESLFDYVCADEARMTAFATESGHRLPALDALRQRLSRTPDLP